MPQKFVYIELDTTTNQWRFTQGSQEQCAWKKFAKGKGHGHEAAILLCLAELQPEEQLPIHTIQTLVQDRGREGELNGTGLKRLYDSINHTGEIAGQAKDTWAWRVVGNKTTNGWGLQLNDGIKISTTRLPASPHPEFLPAGLTTDSHDSKKLASLLKAILSIDLTLDGGDMTAAFQGYETLLQSDFLSRAARVLIAIRKIGILLHIRKFADARTLLNECREDIQCPLLQYLVKETQFLLRTRLRYDRDGPTLTPNEIKKHIDTLTQKPNPSFGLMEAERYNLLGLLHYRQAKKCTNFDQQQREKRAAIHYFHGALLLALATTNYYWVLRFSYNLSLVMPDPIPLLDYAHDVSEKMWVGKNTQWTLLTLCKEMYWREAEGKPITNSEIESLLTKMGMPKTTLPAFWLELVQRAQTTNNPREIGNAYFLAQWGLERMRAIGESRKMQASLDALRKEDTELARVLKADFGGWK